MKNFLNNVFDFFLQKYYWLNTFNFTVKCKKCDYRYKHPIKWIYGFRTGFHKNPKTGETCHWMLFKDGGQTHDYPWE